MSNVIDLDSRRVKDDPVYQCSCGSQRFCLEAGGTVICCECAVLHDDLIWGQHFVPSRLDKPTPQLADLVEDLPPHRPTPEGSE